MDLVRSVLDYLLSNWIAVVALVLSLLGFFLEHLRAFSLTSRIAGRVRVTKNPLSLAESAVIIDLITRNRGSRPGVVQNAAVLLEGPSGSAAFGAHLVLLDRVLNVGEKLPPPEMAPFGGFELGKGDATTTRILMRPRSPGFEWQVGGYRGRVFLWTSAKDAWVKGPAFSFEVEPEDITELADIRAIPQPDGRLYVNWKTRDKVVDEIQSQFSQLDRLLPKSS